MSIEGLQFPNAEGLKSKKLTVLKTWVVLKIYKQKKGGCANKLMGVSYLNFMGRKIFSPKSIIF